MPAANKKKFEQFYQDHFDKVYRFVFFRSGGDREKAEDLVSEIFMKALEHFDTYDKKVSSSAWIMTIARNHLINSWRDAKPTTPLPEDEDTEDERINTDSFWLHSALAVWNKQNVRLEVRDLLASLSPDESEIVTFHYLLGYNYTEIAAIKKMTEGAVKVAAHRALKKLRSRL